MGYSATQRRPARTAVAIHFDPSRLAVLVLLILLILLDERLTHRAETPRPDTVGETGGTAAAGAEQPRILKDAPGATSRAGRGPATGNGSKSHVDSMEERSPLGEKLVKIREEIVASGAPLLSWDELDQEIAEWRGEMA